MNVNIPDLLTEKSDWWENLGCPLFGRQLVNRRQTEAEADAIRTAGKRGRPPGGNAWVAQVVSQYGLQSTLRPRGGQPGRNADKSR